MLKFFKRIFESNSGLSSKRFFGAIGWILSLLIASYCAVVDKEAPMVVEIIIYCSTGLLGLDSVVGNLASAIHGNGNKNKCNREGHSNVQSNEMING